MSVEPEQVLEPIAVIGTACVLPGAPDVRRLWENLRDAVESVTPLDDETLLAAGVPAADLADPAYVKAAAVPEAGPFDAGFFGLTERAAARCDPRSRLFLEVAHAAVEDAGYDIAALSEDAGAFVAGTFVAGTFAAAGGGAPAEPDPASFAAGRLGLRGPAIALSSCSLAAVHLAVQALRTGDCDLALAGGVHLAGPYEHGYRWTPGGPLPPDARARPFDAAAAGAVPGGGAGVVVLKPLEEAILDGDDVRAVIVGGAVAHDGPEPGAGRAAAVTAAMRLAGRVPSEIGYIEADGAGTPGADAAEIAGLAGAYGDLEDAPPQSIPIGSIKSNLGHLGAAAGIAGLLKAILAVRHGVIPATLNIGAPNPALDLPATPFRLARRTAPWPASPGGAGRPRRAAVHGTAPGGGHAHLVLEQGPPPLLDHDGRRPRVVVWSGRDEEAADATRAALARHFAESGDGEGADFAAVAGTLQRGRTAHPVRRAAVCAGSAEAARVLETADAIIAGRSAGDVPRVVFAFPGRHAGPASGLYGVQRTFTETMDVCVEAFENAGIELYDRLVSGSARDGATAEATTSAAEEAMTFATECALAAVWRSWGIRPDEVIAEGAGERAAAVATGGLDLDDAVRDIAGGRGGPPENDAGAAAGGTPPREPSLLVRIAPGEHGTPDDERGMLAELARLWTAGVPVDWAEVDRDQPLQRVPLPGYPHPGRHGRAASATSAESTAPVETRATSAESTAPAETRAVLARSTAPVEGTTAPRTTVRPRTPASAGTPATASVGGPVASAAVPGLPPPARPLRPLGGTQHAFWILEQLAPGTGVSNLCIAFRTAAPLRWWPLQTAVQHLVRRHPALRLRFPELNRVPVQHLTGPQDAEVSLETRAVTEEKLLPELRAFLDAPFDLAADLPFRAGHFTLGDGGSVLSLVAHHIVVDGTSLQILVEELSRFYGELAEHGRIPGGLAGEAPLLLEPEPSPETGRYWLDHLAGVRPADTALPGTRPAPARPTFAGRTRTWEMTQEARRALGSLRRSLRVTDNLVLMSAFYLTLARHGAGPDLVVGVPVDTRRPPARKHVGYGVSTLPIRVRVDPAESFRGLAHRVGEAFFGGLEHAEVSAEVVITERGHDTDDWRVPLFRHIYNHRPWSDELIGFAGAPPAYIKDIFDRSRVDMQFVAVPKPDETLLRMSYSTEVHDDEDMVAFMARLQALLERAAADPDRPVGELDLASDADSALLAEVNRTGRAWDGPPTLAERIAATADAVQPRAAPVAVQPDAAPVAVQPDADPAAVQPDADPVALEPDADPIALQPRADPAAVQPNADPVAVQPGADPVAVVDGDRTLSRRDLMAWAATIRDLLRERGVRGGDVVALALGRSAGMAAAVLGVWAAGAAYLPLDARHPRHRLAYQVDDADARLVLVGEDEGAPWAGDRPALPLPPSPGHGDPPPGVAGPLFDGGPPDAGTPAYVIYTSGSTGRPKGVVVSHRNLANLVLDFADRLAVDETSSVLWSTTTAFDISALELFLPLVCGGRLVVASDAAQLDPRSFLDLIRTQDVSVVQATPTAWRMVLPVIADELRGRTVLCGGEPMPGTLACGLLDRGCRLFNVYGPTETTIWSTAAELDRGHGDPVPIGGPLANTQVFLRDERGRELPPGLPGELCVTGDGVTLGYLGRPELTAERFGEHPRYGRYYRTGDVAVLRHDGVLQMLGRDDRQVKLRGHRIELGEVESALHEHPDVALAAVVLDGDPQADGRLVAFVQAAGTAVDPAGLPEALWRHARERLPDYAVPSGIVPIDSIPVTPNGKISYRDLAAEAAAGGTGARAAERSGEPPDAADPELVAGLAGLWREMLDRPELAEHDNFFLNGGHSILAVRLGGRIEELTGLRVTVPMVFEHPTPAALAARLAEDR